MLAGSVNYLQYFTNKYRKIIMTKNAGATVLSMGADQLKRPEDEEQRHDSKILVDGEAFPIS